MDNKNQKIVQQEVEQTKVENTKTEQFDKAIKLIETKILFYQNKIENLHQHRKLLIEGKFAVTEQVNKNELFKSVEFIDGLLNELLIKTNKEIDQDNVKQFESLEIIKSAFDGLSKISQSLKDML